MNNNTRCIMNNAKMNMKNYTISNFNRVNYMRRAKLTKSYIICHMRRSLKINEEIGHRHYMRTCCEGKCV